MTVRQLNRSDFKAIFEIWIKEVYGGAYRLLYTKEEFFLKTYRDLEALFEAPDNCFIGIEERNQIVGAILGYGDASSSMYRCAFLWISPTKRKLRYASTLSDVLFKFSKEKGYRKFMVETESKNQAVKQILKNMKFHQVRLIWLRVDDEHTS